MAMTSRRRPSGTFFEIDVSWSSVPLLACLVVLVLCGKCTVCVCVCVCVRLFWACQLGWAGIGK